MPYRPTQDGCAGLRARAAGRRPAARGADDRRPLVAGLRHLDLRPGHASRDPAEMVRATARAGFLGDALAGAVRQPGHARPSAYLQEQGFLVRDVDGAAGHPAVVERLQRGARRHQPGRGGLAARRSSTRWSPSTASTASSSTAATCGAIATPTSPSRATDPVGQCEAWARVGREVPVQRIPRLLEDGRPAAGAASARQAADLGRRRAGVADPGFDRAGSDRPSLHLPGHDRRRRARPSSSRSASTPNCSSDTPSAPHCSR